MNRVITSFKKANRDLLKYIMEEYPDGVDEETLVSFPKAGGGSIRALEIEMGDTIYLVKMEDEEYYQKYMAKDDDDDEDDETATVDVEEDIEEVEEAEEFIEDIPFILIEDVPVFPGCKGNNKELKACFTKKVTGHFGRQFNLDLATELGLLPGKKRLFVVFTISKTGKVINVRSRGPHPVLEKEVAKVIGSLPQMKPGKQRGNPVGVSYSIPITFEVR